MADSALTIREYSPDDLQAVTRLHEERARIQGRSMYFFDPEHPSHQGMTIVAEKNGQIEGVATGRRMVEGALTLDYSRGVPGERLEIAMALLEESRGRARALGFWELLLPVPRSYLGWARRLARVPGIQHDSRYHFLLPTEVNDGC